MNIAVIGATGATGMEFVKRALNHGHCLTVLARSPEKLVIQHTNLKVIKGDVFSYEDMAKVVKGQDAIFFALGTGEDMAKSTIRTEATRQMVSVIEAAESKPLVVVVSSLGAGESQQQIPFYIRWYINRKLGHVFADHTAQERLGHSSSLPHLILRPTNMTYDAGTGRVNVSEASDRTNVRAAVARADVASFALDAIERGDRRGALTLTAAS
jgi:putative NADH-flavin reductase